MRFGLLIVLLLLAACSSRPGPDVLNATATPLPPGAQVVTVYVATPRARDPDTGLFLARRAEQLNFAEFVISLPPGRANGTIQWPQGPTDPARTFATLSQRTLTRAEFAARTAPAPGNRRAGVFVHGFNVNFQEGLFRAAQLSADADMAGKTVLFSWPSAGSVTSYVADKDAVTSSRDGLADVLAMLGKPRGERETVVLGHSMGAWLTAEALRQLRLTGRGAVLDKLEVILASPDIDTDVFRTQLEVIGRLRTPVVVLVSPDDRALLASSILARNRGRIGAIDVTDPRLIAAAEHYNVQVIDISSISSGDSLNHGRFVELAGRLGAAERDGESRKVGAFVLKSAGSILASPFTLAGEVLGGD